MAALYSATFTVKMPDGSEHTDGFSFGAADARTMKKADIRKSMRNAQATAKKRAKVRFRRYSPGAKLVLQRVRCIG